MNDEWITTQHAATISGYHPERIRELVREGKLKARKWGPAYQINRKSLEKYLDSIKNIKDKRFGPRKTRSNR